MHVAGATFGVALLSACRRQGEDGATVVVLPSLVRQCWKLVENSAPETARGVYTAAPSALVVGAEAALAARFDSGSRVVLADELVSSGSDAPFVAGLLLLRYLRSLPVSVFSAELLPAMEQASAAGNTGLLSKLIFDLTLEERTFILHFVSHMRTIVKLNLNTVEALLPVFSKALRCSSEMLNVIYNSRRTILQPNCLVCEKIVQLYEPPVFDGAAVTCRTCASKKK